MRTTSTMLAAILCTIGATAIAWGQPSADEMRLAQPGPAHEIFKQFVGTWKTKVTSSMGPGTSAMTGTGTAVDSLILGGRFLEINSVGTVFGKTVANLFILGYDNRKGKYFVFSIDGMGTNAVTAEGDYDQATKTLTLKGEEEMGGMKMPFRFVYETLSQTSRRFSIIFTMPNGKDVTVVKVESTRM